VRDLATLFIHLIVAAARLLRPGPVRSVAAESLLLKHQLLVLSRCRQQAPNLAPADRVIAGLCAAYMCPTRLARSAIVEIKRRNPRFGCRRIAEQISFTFGVDIDKDVVRRVPAKQFRPEPGSGGPSWLTFLGHSKDSLWSVDLFRGEFIIIKSHWVMVVMDQFTRRIIGFGVHAGVLDGATVCRFFNETIGCARTLPRYLSSDHDPLFEFHRWQADLRILEVKQIKTVPRVPLSHPFVERLIGTIRRKCLDHILFWNARTLENKLLRFREYYNRDRVHRGLGGTTPYQSRRKTAPTIAHVDDYRWKSVCRGLYPLPIAA
jgi:transposase InsO family protein